jgi:pimeloyl-ACP methyl ester carboxylesterase
MDPLGTAVSFRSLPPKIKAAPPAEQCPCDAVAETQNPSSSWRANLMPKLKGSIAWAALPKPPRVFGRSLSAAVLMGCCGPIAIGVSKAGASVESLGKSMGWCDDFGTVCKPLPPSKLGELPPAELGRPVVFVPGFHTPKNRFDHLLEKLTGAGGNGGRAYYVRDGEVFADQACTQKAEPKDGRVFVAVFPTTNTPPNEAGPQLGRSLETIQRLTGMPKVDVAAYSMGGLTTRVYLDMGGEAVGKFMMLGTPNQGSAMARSALGILDLMENGWDVQWVAARKPLQNSDRPALGWLLPVKIGSDNPQLEDLNSRWPQQKARTEDVQLVGSNSKYTMGRYFMPDVGDGTVTARSLQIDGENVTWLKDPSHLNHGLLFSNPDTYHEMHRFFGWGVSG